jgi:hypothetical protein
MTAFSFKDLKQVLAGSAEWASLRRAWEESDSLLGLLGEKLPATLFAQVAQVRRSDPEKGVRGSQVTVVARTSAAAAKLRLALADWPAELQAKGLGVQKIAVTAQRIQDIGPPAHHVDPRAPIPSQTKKAFDSLSSEISNEALRKALSRIARPR